MVFRVTALTIEDVIKIHGRNSMRRYFLFLCILAVLSLSCRGLENKSKVQSTSCPCKETPISRETAILIAKGDAIENYTVSSYEIIADEQPGGWRIIFKLKDPGVTGGGPDYLIDKQTGKILHATYAK
jgi:hypothetical protein